MRSDSSFLSTFSFLLSTLPRAPPSHVDFEKSIPRIVAAFDSAGIRYALIGGLAMAFRGAQRATLDIDFILLLDDLTAAHALLGTLGYHREFQSENVSHYLSPDSALGRIDLLHAFRGPTLGMLARAERIAIADGVNLPVVHIEDIIGLKIQASVNDPARHYRDWGDIHMLVSGAAERGDPLNWSLIGEYLALFGLESQLNALQQIHGDAH